MNKITEILLRAREREETVADVLRGGAPVGNHNAAGHRGLLNKDGRRQFSDKDYLDRADAAKKASKEAGGHYANERDHDAAASAHDAAAAASRDNVEFGHHSRQSNSHTEQARRLRAKKDRESNNTTAS